MSEHGLSPEFFAWLDGVLAQPISSDIVAFSVNLYEGSETFDVQLTGSPTFSAETSEWASLSTFTTGEDLFPIPRQMVSDEWQQALNLALHLVKDYLASGRNAPVLRSRTAVAVGFVDGDLHQVWPASAA